MRSLGKRDGREHFPFSEAERRRRLEGGKKTKKDENEEKTREERNDKKITRDEKEQTRGGTHNTQTYTWKMEDLERKEMCGVTSGKRDAMERWIKEKEEEVGEKTTSKKRGEMWQR